MLSEFQSDFSIKYAIYDLTSVWNAVQLKTHQRGWRKLLSMVNFCSDSSDEGFKPTKKSELNEIVEALKDGQNTNLPLS